MADDPHLIFLSAEAFRISAATLFSHLEEEGRTSFIFPIMMTRAFACELYLKCLLTTSGVVAPKIHDLHKLFDHLPKNIQKMTIAHYNKLAKGDKGHEAFFKNHPNFNSDLRAVLENCAPVFYKIRYAYERIKPGDKIHTRFELPTVAVRNVILEYHPDWAPEG